MKLRAAVFNGTVGRLPIERFDIVAAAAHGRGTMQSANVDLPSLHAGASGTFGLRANDPLALQARITSPNVGAFLDRASGRDVGVSGTLDSTMHVNGTRANPQIATTFLLQSLRRGNVTIPAIRGDLTADRTAFTLRNGEIDLQHGKALLAIDGSAARGFESRRRWLPTTSSWRTLRRCSRKGRSCGGASMAALPPAERSMRR